MAKEPKNVGSILTWVGDMANLITNHGLWKIIIATMALSFCISIISIALNPEPILDKIVQILDDREIANRNFRTKNDPLIRSELQRAIYELGACRASIMEFHNGRENPSSLGFWYAEMTYEQTNNKVFSVNSQYRNINLSLLNMSTVLHQQGYWYGSLDELKIIDSNLASIIQNNGTNWIAFLLLESVSGELGILEISFEQEPADKQSVGKVIRMTGISIASMLDYKAHN